MQAGIRTKKLIASALKELCEEKTISKITVNDITKRSGVSRNTFYYHFRDLQELVNWIYHKEVTEPLREQIVQEPRNWEQLTFLSLQTMYHSRNFYIKAMRYTGQNDLMSFSLEEVIGNWTLMAETYISALPTPTHPSHTELTYLSAFFARGAHSMMSTWVCNGMHESPSELAAILDRAAYMGFKQSADYIAGCRP